MSNQLDPSYQYQDERIVSALLGTSLAIAFLKFCHAELHGSYHLQIFFESSPRLHAYWITEHQRD